ELASEATAKKQIRTRASDSLGIVLWLHLLAGSALMLAAILTDSILGRSSQPFGPLRIITLLAGLGMIGAGFFGRRNILTRLPTNLFLPIISLFLILAVSEVFFRAISFDFAQEEKSWRAMPPFFRQPVAPAGKAFFKRPGAERWTGQVLSTYV